MRNTEENQRAENRNESYDAGNPLQVSAVVIRGLSTPVQRGDFKPQVPFGRIFLRPKLMRNHPACETRNMKA